MRQHLFENLMWFRRFGSTRRFHSETFIGTPETVLHHSASTALILIQVLGENVSVNLLKAALCHDLEEGLTGDVPAPVKWAIGNTFEELERRIRVFHDIPFPGLNGEEQHQLKAADFLDCAMTCLMQRKMGNSLIDTVFENLVEYENRSPILGYVETILFLYLWREVKAEYRQTVSGSRYGSVGHPFWSQDAKSEKQS
jgi:hypothetical protein